MQIFSPPKPGQLVSARAARWRVVDVRDHDDCRLLKLTGASAPNVGLERTLLTPFDDVDVVDVERRTKFTRPRVWRRVCRQLIADAAPPGGLRAIVSANVDLMPHQLEPALAVVRGLGSRVLIADEVGLGKTIQAAIVIAELRARAAADRVLVLTPAGLREQWAGELAARFNLTASIVDAQGLRRAMAMLPLGVNPWSIDPIAIASIDYVKRAEVLPAVLACRWDLVIVDEAHGVASDSDRHTAVSAITRQSPFVVLLTATPHSGDRRAFLSLCDLGACDGDALVAFRRTRAAIRGASRRRVHVLCVRPTADELRMHAALRRYTDAVCRERVDSWVAASVLHKRALSSAWSLARSVERRLDAIDAADPASSGIQMLLPLDDSDGELTAADAAPLWPSALSLSDRSTERRLLRSVLEAAECAAAHESKLNALARLLRRVHEPIIVFTEFRDTLLHVQRTLHRDAAILHGGLSRAERAAALATFATGSAPVLLATDAGGEGLNLHHSCRVVVNLELPWNPIRLEQRTGRVDRIGQQRTVHAFHLVARATAEPRILDRLRSRLALAAADIGAIAGNIDATAEEHAIAQIATLGTVSAPTVDDVSSGPPPPIVSPRLGRDGQIEAARLTFARSLCRVGCGVSNPRDGIVLAVRARSSKTRRRLARRILVIYRVDAEDGCARTVESRLVPIIVRVAAVQSMDDRSIDRLLNDIDEGVHCAIERSSAEWFAAIESTHADFIRTRVHRERAIATAIARGNPTAMQPGLFDRRVERRHDGELATRDASAADAARHLMALEHSASLTIPPAAPVLVIVG
jgi:superfamily II DNA or RNA helicase